MSVTLKDNPYLEDNDVTLMLTFKKGNKASFEKLLTKHYPKILNFIYRLINNKQAAEDLTQEVFIKIYRSVKEYQPKAKFTTWAYTIARNLCLNYLRDHKHVKLSLDEMVHEEDDDFKFEMEDKDSQGPDEAALIQEKRDVVKKAIQTLPENQRIAIILLRYENLSYEEIAQTMKLSVSAVKSLLSRAKEGLRQELSRYIKES